MKTILVIDDEPQICRLLTTTLQRENYHLFQAGTLDHGMSLAAARQPDLIILDLGLPDGDGIQFIRDYRQWSQKPIIVLSARVAERDKIKALDLGADDYLEKPFSIGELQARVRVALRRSDMEQKPSIYFAEVEVNLVDKTIIRSGTYIHLTATEFRLLALLVSNPGKVLTQSHLLRHVWGPASSHQSHYLRIYMGHLRQKIEQDPSRPQHFITENGVGYRFMPQPSGVREKTRN